MKKENNERDKDSYKLTPKENDRFRMLLSHQASTITLWRPVTLIVNSAVWIAARDFRMRSATIVEQKTGGTLSKVQVEYIALCSKYNQTCYPM
jgi:hypothetical protein